MIAWVAMTAAGSLGAFLRWQASKRFAPRGTLLVNLTGAFVAGLVTGLHPSSTVLMIAGTGFLGGYTTFSTWMVERTYIATSIVAGLAVASAGFALGSSF
ncbi:fluoride efflux transporter FluC [Solirubrobacter soli]|uniref:fluoride efflux transporter FluC n=1 Tax=Solirubrobacter soli TaxID=363832 RepID=UPI0009FCFD13